MIIFLAILIPIVVTSIFYMWRPKEVTWWEFFVPVLFTTGLIFLVKFIFDTTSVKFTEYWGSTVVEVYESEPWNEWVSQTCSCCCDSDGMNCSYYDCSYQEDHAPYWYARTNIGERFKISEKVYDSHLKKWGGRRVRTETVRNYDAGDRASGARGTKFEGQRVGRESYTWRADWDSRDITRLPYTSKHRYENRIKASDLSVFNISLVDDAMADTLGLFRYPERHKGLYEPVVLGYDLPPGLYKKYSRLNGKYGPSNQLKLWVLVFRNKPSTVGTYQENYWVKGNKNELVVVMSLDDVDQVQWVRTFSWATSDDLTVAARMKVTEIGKMNVTGWSEYHDWLDENLGRFRRREFAEFSYIEVEPSTASIVTIIVLSLLSSIGWGFWIVNNDVGEENKGFFFDQKGRYNRYRRRYR